MPVLIIRENEVRAMVDIKDAIVAVENAFIEQAQGTAYNLPRQRVRQPFGTLHLMGAALVKQAYWGYKSYTTTKLGAKFLINLYDLEVGNLISIIEADYLGQLRTGAASGVATKYLARKNSKTLALFGSGSQAATQVEGIHAVSNLQKTIVYSNTKEHRVQFAQKMSEKLSLEIVPVDSPDAAASQADIITTITTSKSPVFSETSIRKGVHINAAGSNSITRAEIGIPTIKQVDLFFTDDIFQARIESGNLVSAYEHNSFNWQALQPICDVISGTHPGRSSDQEITFFESHGIAIWDIALASIVYERAKSNGIGETINLLE